jgi:hypothetical protein
LKIDCVAILRVLIDLKKRIPTKRETESREGKAGTGRLGMELGGVPDPNS